MKSLITKILISAFILFIIITFLTLNLNSPKINNSIEEEKEIEKQKTYLLIYDVIAVTFLILLIIYSSYNGYVRGFVKTLFIWAFFVIGTPVPEAGLLFTLPLKRYLKIPLQISQIIVSLLSIIILTYSYLCEKQTIKTYLIGTLFLKIINLKCFSIIIISIFSSIVTSKLFDNFINHYIYQEEIKNLYPKISIIILSIIIYIYYLKFIIDNINNKN